MDLSFATTHLSHYTAIPSEPAFEGLKRMARYLYAHPHRPIFYPARVSLTGTHLICRDFDAGKSAEHTISNGIVIFTDSDHARDKATRRSVGFTCVCLGGVTIDHQGKQQSFIALHSTDSETYQFSTGTRRSIFFYQLANFLRTPIAGQPIIIYEDSQPCIDIVSSHQISSKSRHIAAPIAFTYEKICLGIVKPEHITTTLQPADAGTKPQSAPVLAHAFDYFIGVRYYPPPSSQHAIDMNLSDFRPLRRSTTSPTKSLPTSTTQ
jgi:hypothetical protein